MLFEHYYIYTPFCDLFVGNFVFVRLVDPIVYLMWMGRVENDVVIDQENETYMKVYVQWWVVVGKGTKNDEELYHNCWLSKWNYNHADPKQWVEISSVTFYFSVKNNLIVNSMIRISVTHASKAQNLILI